MRCHILPCGILFGLVCGLLLAVSAPVAAGDKEFAAVKTAFAKRDLVALTGLHDKDYKTLILPLSQEQLDRVALLAAEHLEIADVLKGVKYKKFFDLLLPGGIPKVHERWRINWVSMYLLRRLSDERRITDSAVVPHLIEALKHPDTTLATQAYICVRELTFRQVGAGIWGGGNDRTLKEPAVHQWWQDWWQKNKGKQLIITKELEKILSQRTLATTQKIFDSLTAKYPDDLMKVHRPDKLFSAGQTLPYISHEPRWMAYIEGPKFKKISELPLLWVGAQFQTPGEDTTRKAPWLAPVGPAVKMIYEEVLPKTDLAFRVLLETPSPQLEKDMMHLFKNDKKH